jgi:hypothetical protein
LNGAGKQLRCWPHKAVGSRWHAAGMRNPSAPQPATLARLVAEQYCVVSRSQAIVCGLTADMMQRRIRPSGAWQRLLPGVYLTVTGTPTNDQRDMAALLYAGPGSVITGVAALRRHGIRAPASHAVDVLVPARRRRQSKGFVVVQLTTRVPGKVTADGRIEFASPERAVADAARSLRSLSEVRALAAGAVQQGRCTLSQLTDELDGGPIRGSGPLRAVLAEVRHGIRSSPEADLRHLMARAGLPVPLFNPRLYHDQVLIAIPDAWWDDCGVAAEVDSREWHLSPQDWEQTMRRHARMSAAGILVLHFSPRQIKEEPAMVIKIIKSALSTRRGQALPGIRAVPALH